MKKKFKNLCMKIQIIDIFIVLAENQRISS